jgi:hypothetical protein
MYSLAQMSSTFLLILKVAEMFQLSESTVYFHIDVTFEMRTVLYGSSIFLMIMEMSDIVFISKPDGGEESRIVKRQRKCVCVRGSTLRKRRDGVGHKMSR